MKWVFEFSEGSRELRGLLGGKGANIAEMTRLLGQESIPLGFTISTEACDAYLSAGGRFPDVLETQVASALRRLESQVDQRLGDPVDPLLVSVRSGGRESMPGMLDTILNLGLNDDSVYGLSDLDAKALQELTATFKTFYDCPDDPRLQLICLDVCQAPTADNPPRGGLHSARGAAAPACCATRGQADMRGSFWPQDRISS